MKILVTGSAGFIGHHLVLHLLARGDEVVGLDNINDYYDQNLKFARLAEAGINREEVDSNRLVQSQRYPGYRFIRLDLQAREDIMALFHREEFTAVCHLAAQAGVRYSLENPSAYIESNIVGFLSILEACRYHPVDHLLFASSSSVYGLNQTMPFSVHHNVDHPVSLYAASKKSNELMAHAYAHLYGISCSGLRFFTVYGPWGRPDMAPILFAKAIYNDQPIDVFNFGDMKRDFTYIDDIIQGVVLVLDHPPVGNQDWNGRAPDPSTSPAPYALYNIGNNRPVDLMVFIETLEKALGKTAQKRMKPMQPGDVHTTWADCTDLEQKFGYRPNTPLEKGITEFAAWFIEFYT